MTCPSCGRENPEGFRFCGHCGASLATETAQEERKVVTVLFCDLVGFTARSDRADPEDVKARLRPFHTRLKREIQAFGGTLDKFIGDAALGVFGSPASHEDDPERAVRAALAIQQAMAELNASDPSLELTVRQGIETGVAVVAPGIGPQIGESVTGDVVNTASRLQSVAPPGGIVVGEGTHRATRDVFVYEQLDPVTVKGKAEPLSIWRAVQARGRIGTDVTRRHTTPLVGRQQELRVLQDLFARVVREGSALLVTVVGEPGVGKSRLVAELASHVEELPELVTWRQGRCLPYGEGITFWALGEIVKAQAGILDSDPPEAAWAKLDASVSPAALDREWMKQRLAPLIGVESSSVAQREESFTAWRRHLESIATAGPAVFVFEDVHWADPAFLDFVDHVAGSSLGTPMLLVCTSRPELTDRHPDWPASVPRATRLTLVPLGPDDTARLISLLLDRAVLPAETHALLLDRAAGNPLYAEEFVRMLKDQSLLVRVGDTWRLAEAADVPFPDSIQSLIAARVDMLPAEHKAVLQDASVIGKVFWPGAVADVGARDEGAVQEALADLSRKELVRASPDSTIDGEAEYAFWHALVRDVCYQQIPRAARSAKHRAAAMWTEQVAGERVEDVAELLAHHYTTALDLARLSGLREGEDELEARTLRFLVLAGDRALALDVARAERHYARALELAGTGHPARPQVLAKWAEAARQSGRSPEAATALEEAIREFTARSDRVSAARTMGTLSSVLVIIGSARHDEVAAEAVRVLESEPVGSELVEAYARMAGVKLVRGDLRTAIDWADRAMELSASLGIEVPARTLGFRGYARASLGEREGLNDMRRALDLASARGEGRDAAVLYNNLAVVLSPIEGPRAVLAVLREGVEFSERRGIAEFSTALTAASLDQLYEVGEWDEALRTAEAIAAHAEETGDVADLLQARWLQARLLARRGEGQSAAECADWLVEAARESGGAEDLIGGLTGAALGYAAVGRADRALELIAEVDASPHTHEGPTYPAFLCEMVRVSASLGNPSLSARLIEGVNAVFPYHEHALCAAQAIVLEATGEADAAAARYAEAGERWKGFGVLPEQAFALLGQGRSLFDLGRVQGAVGPLGEAARIFDRLGARPGWMEAESLLRASSGTS